MLKVKVTKSFPYAADGIHVRTVEVGEVLEGKDAEVALCTYGGCGEVVPETPPTPADPPKKEEPADEPEEEVKQVEEAPQNKAKQSAPKNKSR